MKEGHIALRKKKKRKGFAKTRNVAKLMPMMVIRMRIKRRMVGNRANSALCATSGWGVLRILPWANTYGRFIRTIRNPKRGATSAGGKLELPAVAWRPPPKITKQGWKQGFEGRYERQERSQAGASKKARRHQLHTVGCHVAIIRYKESTGAFRNRP